MNIATPWVIIITTVLPGQSVDVTYIPTHSEKHCMAAETTYGATEFKMPTRHNVRQWRTCLRVGK